MRPTVNAHERVFRRTQETDEGCRVWTGKRTPGGYGQIRTGRKGSSMAYVHRVIYESLVAPIPPGMTVDHTCHTAAFEAGTCVGGVTCRHRACVNPKHLQAVPHQTNILRGNTAPAANAAKTHCIKDHPFSGPNLILRKSGVRECRTCANAQRRKAGRPTIWPGDSDSLLRHRLRTQGA